MATPRNADRMGWRPGCLVLDNDAAIVADGMDFMPPYIQQKVIELTGCNRQRQLDALITLADVTIAKACVRMPE